MGPLRPVQKAVTSPGNPRVDDIDTRGGKLGRERLPGCPQRVTAGVENESRRKSAQLAAAANLTTHFELRCNVSAPKACTC